MSEGPDTSPGTGPERAPGAGAGRGVRRRGAGAMRIALVATLGVFVLLAAVVAGLRYGVLLPQVRLLIEARTDGLELGRIGRLKIEGLSGDIWRDARVRRLTIRDDKGVWLEAQDVRLTWRYLELLRRRFDADLIEVRQVRVLRRPELGPKGQDRGLPVSFRIDAIRTRLVMEPAFSYERGVYDVKAGLDIARVGTRSARLSADSVLHPGDRLAVDFRVGGAGPLRIVTDAREARGGALAGALGLPAQQAFELSIRADGTTSAGRFSARAVSGDTMPLTAKGAWTPAGGQADGRLSLSASSLTAPLAERLGPEVTFALSGRKAGEGAYALDARAQAEAVQARIWGLGDLGARRTGPAGLRVAVSAPSLSRITQGPNMGAAGLTGVLRGDGTGWRFAGDAAVSAIDLGGYGLNRIAGPVEVAAGKAGVRVETRLAGVGGRGEGFAAALLGGAPTAALSAERLANGQILLRDLDVAGRGLRVEASGGRSLLGGLTFKGRASVSNLEAAQAGARGGAGADWQATQARAGAPWSFTLDARGERLALGVSELDRLLGAAPRLQVRANWQAGRLEVARAALNGAALDASASGTMAANGTLAFKTDWSAQGPVRAGPVEITGRLSGDGRVAGTVAAPRLDLTAAIEQVDVPRLPLRDAKLTLTFVQQADGSNGAVALTADSAFGPARGRADFRFPRGGVDLSDLSVDAGGLTAEGSVSLRRASPSAADLRLEVVKGAFLDGGRLSGALRVRDAAGGPQANLSLRGQAVQLPGSPMVIRTATVTADGPLSRLPYTLDVRGASDRGPWAVEGQGVLSDLAPGYGVTFAGQGRLAGRGLRTTEAASVRLVGDDRTARIRLVAEDGGLISVDGALNRSGADLRARIDRLGLGLFDPDLTGRLNATLALRGQGERLAGDLEARMINLRGRGAPAKLGLDGTVRARLTDDSLSIDLTTTNDSGVKGEAAFVLPAEASAAPFRVAIARQRPMSGRFDFEGEVGPLWDLLIGGDRALSGFVRAQGQVSGALADPRARGSVVVERGRFDDGATGLSLREVAVRASFDEHAVDVTEARGVDGKGGKLNGQGRISLERAGVSSFRLDLQDFRLIETDQASASATGQGAINRAADGKVTLTGDFTINEAEVAADPPVPSGVVPMEVKEINRPDDLQTTVPARARAGPAWALDVRLRAPRRIYLRGRGLDLEMSLDARVGGTTAQPELSGVARVVRGDYDFAGRRFTFDDRGVVYLSTRPQNIRLQLDATEEDDTLTVTVRIRGTAAKPEITLVSSPSLPNDEILAQVLFGRSASQLSAVEAAQLAVALSSLAGGGGFDVVGNLRNFAGLDRLAFGGGDEAGVTVSGGKYLTDDVYLELTGGGREGPTATVEWRIRKNLSILSRLAGESGNRIAIRWRRDY